jgi:hypothetical protein
MLSQSRATAIIDAVGGLEQVAAMADVVALVAVP